MLLSGAVDVAIPVYPGSPGETHLNHERRYLTTKGDYAVRGKVTPFVVKIEMVRPSKTRRYDVATALQPSKVLAAPGPTLIA